VVSSKTYKSSFGNTKTYKQMGFGALDLNYMHVLANKPKPSLIQHELVVFEAQLLAIYFINYHSH
jgi:hypothetical protein